MVEYVLLENGNYLVYLVDDFDFPMLIEMTEEEFEEFQNQNGP